jgi:DNA-directed RNA polymerase specialized sigma24 family protein
MLSTEDVEALYRSSGDYLQRLVRTGTGAADEVIEDACQHAWSSVLAHRERVQRPCAFAYLVSAAIREAWRLEHRWDACWWPLEAHGSPDSEGALRATPVVVAAPTRTPLELVELRDGLRILGALPERQQRVLWLHAAGHTYAEIARHEGMTLRTVERQLLRGKRAARALMGLDGGSPSRVAVQPG